MLLLPIRIFLYDWPNQCISETKPSQYHRPLVGELCRWRLDALLATYVPAGKPISLAPAVLASLKQALHGREGFASYEALANRSGRRMGWRSSTKRSMAS